MSNQIEWQAFPQSDDWKISNRNDMCWRTEKNKKSVLRMKPCAILLKAQFVVPFNGLPESDCILGTWWSVCRGTCWSTDIDAHRWWHNIREIQVLVKDSRRWRETAMIGRHQPSPVILRCTKVCDVLFEILEGNMSVFLVTNTFIRKYYSLCASASQKWLIRSERMLSWWLYWVL